MATDTMQLIQADDERLVWSGALGLQRGRGWVQPWRLPHADLDLFPPPGLHENAAMPAGVRLRLATDADYLALIMEPASKEGNLDLVIAGEIACTVPFMEGDTRVEFSGLPAGDKSLEVWFHQITPVRLRGLELPQGARLERSEDRRPRWITYGSSISHCAAAASPARTWPGLVARARDVNLTCLGFGGQCHLDGMVARLIRDREADFISLKLGINIQGAGSLNERSFLPAMLGAVATIRDRHARTPLVVCSPIISPPREEAPNAVGMTLRRMREILRDGVERLRRRGDEHIHYVDGLKLFGEGLLAHLPDELHPDAEGYKLLGRNFLRETESFWPLAARGPGAARPGQS